MYLNYVRQQSTITKLTFLYLEIDTVIDSGIDDQVLKPTDHEKNDYVDDCKPDSSNVFTKSSFNSVPQVSGIYFFLNLQYLYHTTCKAIKTFFIKIIASEFKLINK